MKVLIFGKVLKIFYLEKKTCNIYAHMFEFTFPREDVIELGGQEGVVIKRGRGNI